MKTLTEKNLTPSIEFDHEEKSLWFILDVKTKPHHKNFSHRLEILFTLNFLLKNENLVWDKLYLWVNEMNDPKYINDSRYEFHIQRNAIHEILDIWKEQLKITLKKNLS